MRRSAVIRASDAKELLRIVAEACESAPTPRLRVAAIATRMGDLLGARIGTVCHLQAGERMDMPTPLRIVEYIETGHWNATDRRVLQEYYTRGDHEEDLVARSIGELHRRNDPSEPKPPALRREDLVPDEVWYGSEHFNDFRRVSDIDSCIYSGVFGDTPGQILGMTFHRARGERGFTPRDRALVEILQTGAEPIFRAFGRAALPGAVIEPKPSKPGPQAPPSDLPHLPHLPPLPPRLRQVLAALAAGDSEKQAARRLGLSDHAVHANVKRLYRRLGVSSRGELLSLLIERM